ncbi:Molybdopterin biosynthesis MoaE [Chytriomyces sp. MP71]|nr:Molybdopterin biosynthesis MoaE [Chytriomyces sp. MP71]
MDRSFPRGGSPQNGSVPPQSRSHRVLTPILGIVPPGEASVAIAVSSPHRKDALHAVEYLIDEVKRVAPIWKKEVYADETSNWKQNCC